MRRAIYCVLITTLCIIFISTGQAYSVDRVYQNFDSIPVTPLNQVPASGGDWSYSSKLTNPDNRFGMTQYDYAGWWNTVGYASSPSTHDYFQTSGVDTNQGGGNIRYQFFEIDNQISFSGNSLKQVITGGWYDDSGNIGEKLNNKKAFIDFLDDGIDPVGS